MKKKILKYNNKNNKNIYVLSEYLQNQLLINNKVFNFRVFYLVSLVNNKYRSYLILPLVIHLANKEKSNLNLNLSELITSDGTAENERDLFQDNYLYNDLVNKIGFDNNLFMTNQIKHILSKLFKLIKYKCVFSNYDNNLNTYEIFGLDFIADEYFNIKLIEFNNKVGINDYSDLLYKTFVSCIINATINKLYEKEYHIKIDSNIKQNIINLTKDNNYGYSTEAVFLLKQGVDKNNEIKILTSSFFIGIS